MNIIDYIKWRGDLSFKQDPFNEIDNLCLAYLSYVLLEPYIDDINYECTLKEISDAFFIGKTDNQIRKSKSFIGLSPFLLREMGNSKRYGTCRLHHFVSILDNNKTEQFCAMQIDLDEHLTYVSFRGTDDTLLGWEEDFKASYTTISAQIAGKEYVNNYLLPTRKYIYGGHSKGGNIAIYAAAYTNQIIKKRIINIYSNDGPGFRKEFIETKEFKSIKDKIIKIVPQTSIIGMIMHDVDNRIVIESDNTLLMQHDGLSWQVLGNSFIRPKSLSTLSKSLNGKFNELIDNSTIEELKDFVYYLMNILDELNITDIHDLSATGVSEIINALKNATNISESNKKLILGLVKVLNNVVAKEIALKQKEFEENTTKVLENIKDKLNI